MECAHYVSRSCLAEEREQTVQERGDSPDSHRRAESPRKAQVLEIALPCAARGCEEQTIDQSGGHELRPHVEEGSLHNLPDCGPGNSILLHQLKPKEKQ